MSDLTTEIANSRSSAAQSSLSSDVVGGTQTESARKLIYIDVEDPRVTESVAANMGEKEVRTGQVRLKWLMPFALARLGKSYEVWDPQTKAMVSRNCSLPLRPVVGELSDLLRCGEDFVFELVLRLVNYSGGPHNATAKDMMKVEQGGGKGTGRLETEQEEALRAAVWKVCVDRGMRVATRKTNDEIRQLLKSSGAFAENEIPTTSTIVQRSKSKEIATALADAYERDHLNRVMLGAEEIQGCHSQVLLDCSTMTNEFEEVRVVDLFGNDLGIANSIWGINAATRGVWTVWGFPGTQNSFLTGYAIRNGLIDKDPLLKSYGFAGASWPFHGRPGEIRHDHGSEFINSHIKAALLDRDVKIGCIDYSPPQTPHARGIGERFNRTAQQLFAEFLQSDIARKYRRTVNGKPDALGITNDDLNKALVEWVVTQYHFRPNKGLGGDSPMSRWEKMVLGKNGRPFSGIQMPLEDTDELKWSFLLRELRTVNHVGIQFENRTYRSPVLNRLLATNSRSSERKIEFRYSPYKLGRIYLKLPDEEGCEKIHEIPWVKATDKYFASREKERSAEDPTRWEWRQLFSDFRAGNTSKPTAGLVEELSNAKEEAATAGHASRGKSVKTAKKLARAAMRGFGADAIPKAHSPAAAPEAKSNITYQSDKPPARAIQPVYLSSDGGASDY